LPPAFAKRASQALVTRVIWLLLIPAAFICYIFWAGRRHICIRRKDCCGKGCGCLFPVKLKDK
jgi:hypothetical protein